ncbi:3-isopropylmalate dehydrogenase [Candidatus Gottesmanbacteria bacterium RIFCSPLOWO2_02_FULL_42_29]|uniref:3-isopropylmalate dehydrogenase n=2 Tax=Candidatus Gottesmaniibacteriota TaxID=1752720 RepID=A0A1F6B9S7_9BACT|nr:MAG: 3-isopropylmalate dehydrogenase [Candidatus Gottesmanbacteria bacterium GW2011_GWA2_42_18]OGG09949.1 MAG: 3-isopropylmalate dehydrogenase [Candidatus Gottesmanbacteria bacterium RIFCSPHIGHO2_01_FULL_42_27]OGG19545.1 MAG: 3-isopropylmalate dehydrogenase [Candidatus Gottesmanbacteria bacterium RIFCSPHIGHO2_12_FULL_43_26]OGG33512.1 MAG: 3-isopropylmalate dehydrogenase [Candidatus Gottesmanbacteria bacterium RIFCSPLOWO2_01_FULL_42_22]OGG34560.1 MAG: 3-isopropylmalate dehydrogenase [Candidat
MKKTIAVLPGDGIGPEVVRQAVKVLKSVAYKFGHEFIFREGLIGAGAIQKTGRPLPEETLKLSRQADAILLGAIGDPKYDKDPQAKIRPEQGLLKLRKSLNLFANLRPVKIYPQLLNISPLKNERIKKVDIMVVRELTGGIYFGQHRRYDGGYSASDLSVYTKNEITRVAKIAFNHASRRKKILHSIDKANVLATSCLWRETVSDLSEDYPEVEVVHMFVDTASMQLVKNPRQFDVILTENMFGDILTDEASVIAGSIGLLPSASIGDKHALYEPIHGAFNKAAGKNIANPIGTILSAAMMLKMSFQLDMEARAIERAIEKVIDCGFCTKEIAGENTEAEKILGTKEIGNLLAKLI